MTGAIAPFGFELPPEILVLGLVTGLSYALLGAGLLLTYRSSRILNFAHGEMGALGAALIPVLVINQGVNYWLALAVALTVAAAGGGFTELVVVRKLANAPRLIVLVATIGVSQLFFAIGAFIPKEGELGSAVFPTPFSAGFSIGTLRLTSAHLLIIATVPVVTAVLAAFLRRTRIGLASRAAAENDEAAQLAGIPIRRVSLVVWTAVGLLAGISAVLLGPTRPVVNAVALGPSLMLRALAAAMLGGMSSLPRVFAGGIAIGLIETTTSWNYPTGGVLEVVLFAVILGSLLWTRSLSQAARGGEDSSWSLAGAVRALPPAIAAAPKVKAVRRATVGAVVAFAVLLPMPLSNSTRVLMSSVVLFALMGLSLVVLTGYAGQVSLGQFAFVGLGAMVGGRLHQLGYPPLASLAYALIAGGVAACLVGLPALRIRGLFLAVTTLGFAVVNHQWLAQQRWLVQVVDGRTSLEIPRPVILGVNLQDERTYYWVCLAVLVLVGASVSRLRRTGAGRSMMAVRDNEAAAAALGINPRRVKLLAFMLSGVVASLAGYLYGGLLVSFPDPTTFAPELSLALVALVILGGVTSVTGAVLGALWVRGLAHLLGPLLPNLFGSTVALLVGGVGLLGAILQFPAGLASVLFTVRDKLFRALAGGSAEVEDVDQAAMPRPRLAAAAPAPSPDGEAAPPSIEGRGILVRFGGNAAVDGASIEVHRGEIVGLVGPNGAGKTTLFDVLSGHLRADAGQVLVGGVDVTALRPEARAKLGVGRTFQQARLFGELPLLDAFKVALERQEPSELVPSLLGLPPSRETERRKDLRAEEIVALLGLERMSHLHIAELSTGTRRLAEFGCMIALGADVLLLDEPTAGIAQREVEAFRPVLREIRDHLDASVLIVEHDIPLMMGLVDRLYVLAAGQVIAEGPPAVLREDPAVVAAYLGTDERVIARSGAVSRPARDPLAAGGTPR